MNKKDIENEIQALIFTQRIYEDAIIYQDACPEEYEAKIQKIEQQIQILKQELVYQATTN